MTTKISLPQHCMDGKKDISFAKDNGCNIRRGKGDHVVIEFRGKQEVIPDREIGFGLACKIFKFFKTCGFISLVLIILYNIQLYLIPSMGYKLELLF